MLTLVLERFAAASKRGDDDEHGGGQPLVMVYNEVPHHPLSLVPLVFSTRFLGYHTRHAAAPRYIAGMFRTLPATRHVKLQRRDSVSIYS